MRLRRVLASRCWPRRVCRAAPAPGARRLPRSAGGPRRSAGAGRDRELGPRASAGRHVRLNDVAVRDAARVPPSRLRFTADIPKGGAPRARLRNPVRVPRRPGVEFVVKVVQGGREDVAWSLVLNPLEHPEHRHWVHAEVDLVEVRGHAAARSCWRRPATRRTATRTRAYWGAPALTIASRDGGAARDRVPRRHAARGPHAALRVRARHDAELAEVRAGRASCSSRRSRRRRGPSRRWPRS